MRVLALVAALLAAAPAFAECPWQKAPPPPARFDHAWRGSARHPWHGMTALRLLYLPLAKVSDVCAEAYVNGQGAAGCMIFREGIDRHGRVLERWPLIVLPRGCPDILRHELGHANGWTWRHER